MLIVAESFEYSTSPVGSSRNRVVNTGSPASVGLLTTGALLVDGLYSKNVVGPG